MYNGTLDSQRFSRLDRIDRGNVADLELKWAHHIPQLDRAETTPLVVDGVMFITESPSNVVAVDAATGRPFWRYDHPCPTICGSAAAATTAGSRFSTTCSS